MHSQPIAFHPPTDDVPTILLPVRSRVFAERAERFKTLANGHSLAEWLRFLGHLTQAQHTALQSLGALSLPNAAILEQSLAHGMPPLNATSLACPPIWREVLSNIIDAVQPHVPGAASTTLAALRNASAERLETLANALLDGHHSPRDQAEHPFVAAALQVVWTAQASQLDTAMPSTLDTPGVCPCCGSLPIASIVRTSPLVNNLRYLHCSLCNSEWNMARALCSACNTDKSVAYQKIEGTSGAAQAESCDACKSYLKIFYQEKDFHVDPVADDLATLVLDLLLDEAGYARSGPNPLLIGGAG